MKISEFKKLIREEVRKVLKEANKPAFSFKELTDLITQFYTLNDGPAKKKVDKLLLDVGFFEKGTPDYGNRYLNRDRFKNYKTTDNKTGADLLKWYDKVRVKLSKSWQPTAEPIAKTTPSPKPGQKITDSDLVDDGFISGDDMADAWLDLLADERLPDDWINNTAQKAKVLKLANTWLKKNGYAWQVADALTQDEDGVVTWKIK